MKLNDLLALQALAGVAGQHAKTVSPSVPIQTGVVFQMPLFGLKSPVAFVKTGGNANLSISSGGAISATVAIAAGASQTISGTVTGADGWGGPFTANLMGAISVPAAPTLGVPTAASGQLTIPWTDGATGGAAITSHKLYASTTSGFTPGPGNLVGTIFTGSPYALTGLTDGVPLYYRMSAVNSAGEGALSAEQTGTPASGPSLPSFDMTIGSFSFDQTAAWSFDGV